MENDEKVITIEEFTKMFPETKMSFDVNMNDVNILVQKINEIMHNKN